MGYSIQGDVAETAGPVCTPCRHPAMSEGDAKGLLLTEGPEMEDATSRLDRQEAVWTRRLHMGSTVGRRAKYLLLLVGLAAAGCGTGSGNLSAGAGSGAATAIALSTAATAARQRTPTAT